MNSSVGRIQIRNSNFVPGPTYVISVRPSTPSGRVTRGGAVGGQMADAHRASSIRASMIDAIEQWDMGWICIK